jgi:hypothetical protein
LGRTVIACFVGLGTEYGRWAETVIVKRGRITWTIGFLRFSVYDFLSLASVCRFVGYLYMAYFVTKRRGKGFKMGSIGGGV